MTKSQNTNIVVVLNNVRSNENVGSIFRTCDAAGVSKIFLCGYTPAPVDRFGRENKGLTKAALGAEKFIQWERAESLKEAVGIFDNTHSGSCLVVGIEQSKNSIDYRELKNSYLLPRDSNIILVFGNEVDGLSEEDLKLCDMAVEIPMLGHKESLNVAVTVGIILFSIQPNRQ